MRHRRRAVYSAHMDAAARPAPDNIGRINDSPIAATWGGKSGGYITDFNDANAASACLPVLLIVWMMAVTIFVFNDFSAATGLGDGSLAGVFSSLLLLLAAAAAALVFFALDDTITSAATDNAVTASAPRRDNPLR